MTPTRHLQPPEPAPPDSQHDAPPTDPPADPPQTDPAAESAAPQASTSQPSGDHERAGPGAGLIAVGSLIALCIVAGLIVLAVRKRLFASDTNGEDSGLLLDSLRDMLKSGQITQAEFDAAKKTMVAKLSASLAAGQGVNPGGSKVSDVKELRRKPPASKDGPGV